MRPILDNVGFDVDLPSRIAVVGPAGSGKEELTLVLANLLDPNAGRILIADHEVQRLAEAVTGRQITYVGYPARAVLRHDRRQPVLRAQAPAGTTGRLAGAQVEEHKRERHEAARSATRPTTAGPTGSTTMRSACPVRTISARSRSKRSTIVQLDREVYQMGLRGSIDPEAQPELAELFLAARRAMGERLDDSAPRPAGRGVRRAALQHQRDARREPPFGAPSGEAFDIDHLAAHPYVQQILAEAGLTEALLEVGLQLADTMVELFADLPPDHEYFRQFSFINADDLPDYRALLTRADPTRLDALSPADRERLMALTFKLIPARHRLDLIDEPLQERVLEARQRFREQLPAEHAGAGRVLRGRALHRRRRASRTTSCSARWPTVRPRRPSRISGLIAEVLDDLGLRERVIEVGLQAADRGRPPRGCRCRSGRSSAIARALLKRPRS